MKTRIHTDWVKSVVRGFAGQDNSLVIPRTFIKFTGSLEGAILLSQIIYWSDRTSDPDGWFYKTYSDWEEEIELSEYQVRRQAKRFQNRDLIETRVKKVNGNPTLHYRLKWDVFSETFLEFLQEPTRRNSRNLVTEETQGTNPKDLGEPLIDLQILLTDPSTDLTHKSGNEREVSELNQRAEQPNQPEPEQTSQSLPRSVQPESLGDAADNSGDKSSAPADFFSTENITAPAWHCHEAPWHDGISSFKDSMLQAVADAGGDYWRLPNGKRNDTAIAKHLRKLESQARVHFGDGTVDARQSLLDYYRDAQAVERRQAEAAAHRLPEVEPFKPSHSIDFEAESAEERRERLLRGHQLMLQGAQEARARIAEERRRKLEEF